MYKHTTHTHWARKLQLQVDVTERQEEEANKRTLEAHKHSVSRFRNKEIESHCIPFTTFGIDIENQ